MLAFPRSFSEIMLVLANAMLVLQTLVSHLCIEEDKDLLISIDICDSLLVCYNNITRNQPSFEWVRVPQAHDDGLVKQRRGTGKLFG